MLTLSETAVAILATADPERKCHLTYQALSAWRAGELGEIGSCTPPDRPARPERPELLPPNKMPKRSYGGVEGRVALLHALAHIELNAIDLAWDIIARFTDQDLPRGFYDDWIVVARDEANHFAELQRVMRELGSEGYGALPAHDGLWQAATKTADDLKARLAVVPMTLEARGLDTTPGTIARLERNGDTLSPPVLAVIAEDEIAHVAAGTRWFRFLCQRDGVDPVAEYHRLIRARFAALKAPFNVADRARAGLGPEFYEPLSR
jgi:uncharacterized ferritin-like protein (DUF455 family)